MRKTGLWRGLATLMASLLIFAIAAQITTNNWSARINSMLGTTNYEVVADDNAGSGKLTNPEDYFTDPRKSWRPRAPYC